MKQMVVVGF